jgi:hypothetical protein
MGLDEGYVGVTTDPKRRWSEHRNFRYNYPIQKAIKKYGEKLTYQIIGCFDSEEEALWQEYTLRPFKSIGWNIRVGGVKSPSAGGHTEETKRKIGVANSKRIIKDETRFKQSFIAKNRPKKVLKPVDIYLAGEKVASRVSVVAWAKSNKVSIRLLYETLKANPDLPSSRTNVHQTKGFYARYST